MAARRDRRRNGSRDAPIREYPDAERVPEREPEPGETQRARRYLDLWERNLTHLALHGPAARGRRGS